MGRRADDAANSRHARGELDLLTTSADKDILREILLVRSGVNIFGEMSFPPGYGLPRDTLDSL
jgi:hypothetical protein